MEEGGDVMEYLNEFNHFVNDFVAGGGQVRREGQRFTFATVIVIILQAFSDHIHVWQGDSLVRGGCPRHHFLYQDEEKHSDDKKNEGLLIKGSNDYH